MIWTDPPYGVTYSEKTNWLSAHRSGPSRRPIENDSLKPDQLQKLFAMALEVSRQHAMPGAVIYATVPGAYLKYFIAGLEDGGLEPLTANGSKTRFCEPGSWKPSKGLKPPRKDQRSGCS
jgi:hypothetical protein